MVAEACKIALTTQQSNDKFRQINGSLQPSQRKLQNADVIEKTTIDPMEEDFQRNVTKSKGNIFAFQIYGVSESGFYLHFSSRTPVFSKAELHEIYS